MSQQSNQAPASVTYYGTEPEEKKDAVKEAADEYQSLEEALLGES